MAYADYAFYTTEYKGNAIPEADFNRFAEQASAHIDTYTFDRAKDYTDTDNKLKKACCVITSYSIHYTKLYEKNNRLFIFDEDRRIKTRNKATADILINEHGIKPNDLIICDSSENKSVGDYRAFGLSARGAEKGPDSVDYSIKWLQGLDEIIIDNSRCPYTADEFLNYEYARDKQGVIIPGYVDKNNHHIDAVRYSLEPVWKRRGK